MCRESTWERYTAPLIRGYSSCEASLSVEYAYAGARQDRATWVGNGSENTAEIGLRKQREREKQHNQSRTEQPHCHSGSGRAQCDGFHSAPFSSCLDGCNLDLQK